MRGPLLSLVLFGLLLPSPHGLLLQRSREDVAAAPAPAPATKPVTAGGPPGPVAAPGPAPGPAPEPPPMIVVVDATFHVKGKIEDYAKDAEEFEKLFVEGLAEATGQPKWKFRVTEIAEVTPAASAPAAGPAPAGSIPIAGSPAPAAAASAFPIAKEKTVSS